MVMVKVILMVVLMVMVMVKVILMLMVMVAPPYYIKVEEPVDCIEDCKH